jgi:c-di-GMP-binding flagellar brake protein YcgR
MATVFAQNGYKMELLNEGTQLPDVRINGELADLKCTASHNNIVRYAKKAVREQGAKMVLFQFDEISHEIQHELYKLQKEEITGMYFITDKNIVYPF